MDFVFQPNLVFGPLISELLEVETPPRNANIPAGKQGGFQPPDFEARMPRNWPVWRPALRNAPTIRRCTRLGDTAWLGLTDVMRGSQVFLKVWEDLLGRLGRLGRQKCRACRY